MTFTFFSWFYLMMVKQFITHGINVDDQQKKRTPSEGKCVQKGFLFCVVQQTGVKISY